MFRKAPKPRKGEIAVRTGIWVGNYGPAIGVEHGYWEHEEERLADTSDLAGHSMANGIHTLFHSVGELLMVQGILGIGPREMDPTIREVIRRGSLGALAISRLIRHEALVAGGIAPGGLRDGLAAGHINTIIDANYGDNGLPIDYRVHLAADLATEVLGSDEAGWFRDSDLWVYRADQAEPSAGLLRDVIQHELSVDFSELATLYPYMKTK